MIGCKIQKEIEAWGRKRACGLSAKSADEIKGSVNRPRLSMKEDKID
jgi:hypothetical protein